MSFATPTTVSAHNATLTASRTTRRMRSDRFMPQLQIGPDTTRAADGLATLACVRTVVKARLTSRVRRNQFSGEAERATRWFV